jgi:hypothetical protein
MARNRKAAGQLPRLFIFFGLIAALLSESAEIVAQSFAPRSIHFPLPLFTGFFIMTVFLDIGEDASAFARFREPP